MKGVKSTARPRKSSIAGGCLEDIVWYCLDLLGSCHWQSRDAWPQATRPVDVLRGPPARFEGRIGQLPVGLSYESSRHTLDAVRLGVCRLSFGRQTAYRRCACFHGRGLMLRALLGGFAYRPHLRAFVEVDQSPPSRHTPRTSGSRGRYDLLTERGRKVSFLTDRSGAAHKKAGHRL
jgi:hypothetical protein